MSRTKLTLSSAAIAGSIARKAMVVTNTQVQTTALVLMVALSLTLSLSYETCTP